MAGVLLAASVFLIVNTIRLATYARRREIEVMKLVGASNWFVRVPFLAEGFVQGAIGAGLAFGGVFLLESWLGGVLSRSKNLFSTFYLGQRRRALDRHHRARHRHRDRHDRLVDRDPPLPRGVTGSGGPAGVRPRALRRSVGEYLLGWGVTRR